MNCVTVVTEGEGNYPSDKHVAYNLLLDLIQAACESSRQNVAVAAQVGGVS